MRVNEMIAPDKGALRKAEAAAFVGLPTSSFDRLVRSGQAPNPIYISQRRPVWPKEVLLKWLRDLGVLQNGGGQPKVPSRHRRSAS
jgi:predicted DNA-binding transcriptional regulator AlpA